MNQLSGGEAAVLMLKAHGVRHIFGLCGDTSLPFYDALARLDHGMTHILTRDERHAAYMADCYARVSGRVGVCEGPSGGGATYMVPGVVEANESSIPVLAITTDISVSSRGKFTLTELDQEALFRPLTKFEQGDRPRRRAAGGLPRRVSRHDLGAAGRCAYRAAVRRPARSGRRGRCARRSGPRRVPGAPHRPGPGPGRGGGRSAGVGPRADVHLRRRAGDRRAPRPSSWRSPSCSRRRSRPP